MTMSDDALDLGGDDAVTTLVSPDNFERNYPLRDLSVRADEQGERRIVEAMAAVYDREIKVSDWEGEYREVIRRGAFTKTISERGNRFQVFYNHGRDLYGMPAERYAMPIGVPVEVREDTKGVVTATRFSTTELANEVLQLIEDKAIRGMSFGGRWIQSKETEPTRANQLRLVERLEVDMREYGPTPFPAYEAARVMGVRNATMDRLADLIRSMPLQDRERLATLLGSTPPAAAATAPQQASGPLETQPDLVAAAARAELDRWTFDLEQRKRRMALG